MRVAEVFVAGGLPSHTYNPRDALRLEAQLRDYLDERHKLLTVTGPTKSGKTVLVRTVIPESEAVWLEGGQVGDEAAFWEAALERMELYNTVQLSRGSESTESLEGGVEGGVNIGAARLTFNFGAGTDKAKSRQRILGRAVSAKVRVLAALSEEPVTLVIDDFHYIPRETQARLIRSLKAPIFSGVPVVVLAVPHRKFDVVRVEREMTGRVEHIDVNPWEIEELLEIPHRGLPLLNLTGDDGTLRDLAEQSFGSPHLMQDFCRRLCKVVNGVEERADDLLELGAPSDQAGFFGAVAEDTSRSSFDLLAKGPRQRSDRIQRTFKDGRTGDIYIAVLHALAAVETDAGKLSYEEIRAGLRDLLLEAPPQAHEVTRVLEHMAKIASDDSEAGVPVLEWDGERRDLVGSHAVCPVERPLVSPSHPSCRPSNP